MPTLGRSACANGVGSRGLPFGGSRGSKEVCWYMYGREYTFLYQTMLAQPSWIPLILTQLTPHIYIYIYRFVSMTSSKLSAMPAFKGEKLW